MFHVGQLVVCVDDRPSDLGIKPMVRRGAIYTVAGIDQEPGYSVFGICLFGLHLDEVDPRPPHVSFAPNRFRPLDDSRIAIFRKMLAPSPAKEAHDA